MEINEVSLKEKMELISKNKDTKKIKTHNQFEINILYKYALSKIKKDTFLQSNQEYVLNLDPLSLSIRRIGAEQDSTKITSFGPLSYYKEARLDNFLANSLERQLLLSKALEIIENVKNSSYSRGLLISGDIRTGKTYFLSAIANELSKYEKETLFMYSSDLNRIINGSLFDKTLEDKVEKLKNVDCLVIDDLGNCVYSLLFRDEVLNPVINYRLVNKKLTFISSNFAQISDLSNRLINDDPNYKVIVGRMMAKVLELCEPIILNTKYKQ
ncbi:MAG: hypothetical protein LBV51_03535 [Acholeplasmatales bacterium]|jgi:primosomal protein DnaI|nr:hypothetical protein [Acholeplasmatales bacterium]